MPILVAQSVVPEPPAPPPPPPPPAPPLPLNEAPQVSFTDPAGRVTLLTDWERGWVLQPGAKGMDMPQYSFTNDESPGIDGYAVRQVRAGGKDITLPIAFWMQDSRAAYVTRRRALINSLNPKRGPGTLTVTQPDGSFRTIDCYYTGGLEGDESRDAAGMRWCITVLTMACPSPYWLGETVELSWRTDSTANFFPLLPLTVKSSQVLGSVTVDNPGDDDAFPVWTIEGPATAVTLTNTITDPRTGDQTVKTLTLTRTLTASDTVVIDTRERRQTAVLNGSTNLWPDLSDASELWALEPGENQLTLAVSGSDSNSLVSLTYQPRYLAA